MAIQTANQTESVLELTGLCVEYVGAFHRTPAVRDLSLRIERGEVYGIVGESGCGKSTVALACVRYLPRGTRVSGGLTFWDSRGLAGPPIRHDLLKASDRLLRRLRGNRIAMVYQDPLAALNPSLSMELQMAEILTTHTGATAREARGRCVEMLERVRIADPGRVLRAYPHQLSGGMQQRVLIAMALLLKPSLLIMDEPTTGLDVTVEAAVLDLVNDLRREYETAILFISHNLGVIARLCDRVGVMYAGEMVEEGTTREIFKNPRHPYTLSLLHCIPDPGVDKRTRALWSIPGRVPRLDALPLGCAFASRCAIARPTCAEAPIPLFPLGAQRQSRCLYANEIDSAAFGAHAGTNGSASSTDGTEPLPNGDLLAVQDLRVYYPQRGGSLLSFGRDKKPVKAVDGVTFRIDQRRTLGIAGESGCGKSTVARTIAGLTPLTAGSIGFARANLTQPVQRRTKRLLSALQMVFQNPDSTLNPQKTVEEELRRPLRLLVRLKPEQEDAAISDLLRAVSLDDSYRTRYPGQLSGGEKQRVAIARAFAGRPRLVLCDEPISSLDVSVQSTILNLLLNLQREYDVSLLFISHDLGVVRYLSDDVAIMYLGKICEYGSAEQVFAPPHHPYTEALLSAIPVPDPTAKSARIRLDGSVPSPSDPPRGCPFHTRCPRKVGPICEAETPPAREHAGHVIHCHIPLEELTRVQLGRTVDPQ